MARQRSFSDKFWHDKHGNFVAWQKPNIFLWVWFVTAVVNFFLQNNSLERYVGYVGMVSILIWAALELFRGVNYFRRTLGLCVLLLFLVIRLTGL